MPVFICFGGDSGRRSKKVRRYYHSTVAGHVTAVAATTRVGAQTWSAREYWEGEIITTRDNSMAFFPKNLSRYKSID